MTSALAEFIKRPQAESQIGAGEIVDETLKTVKNPSDDADEADERDVLNADPMVATSRVEE